MLAASSASGSWQYLLAKRRQASASFNWNGPWQFLAINCSRNDHIQCWDKNYEKRKILSTLALSRSPGFMSEPWKIIASFQQRRIKVRIVLNQNQAELKSTNLEAKATERYLIWVCLRFSSPSNSKSGSVLWRKTTISSTCTLMGLLYLLQTVLKGRTISKTEPGQYWTEVIKHMHCGLDFSF